MIDKRISYRFGGGYQGRDTSPSRGPAGGASSGGNYGSNTGGGGGRDRQAPAPVTRPSIMDKDPEQITREVKALQDKVKTYQQDFKAKDYVLLDKYMGDKDLYPSPDEAPLRENIKLPAGLDDVPGDKTFEPVEKYSSNIGPSLHGGDTVKEALKKAEITKMIRDQALEKLDVIPDDTTQLDLNKFGETVTPVKPDLRTQKEKDEDFERDQDWDLIKDMSDKGYDFNEIQSAIDKGLTVKAPTTDTRRQNLIDFGLRSIIPKTGLEKSLLSRMKSFVPGAQTGISSLTDRMGSLGNFFNPQKMMTNFALSKMGLGWLNPILGIASLFGFKNPLANIGTKWSGIPTKKGPDIPTDRDDDPLEPQNVMQASIQKFKPTDQQTAQMNEIMRKRMILQGYADK